MNSNKRKKILSGWLNHNAWDVYNNSLKLQKFLFFYEMMSYCKDSDYDFCYLQGWRNGPVFSTVWGDRYYRTDDFEDAIMAEYKANQSFVDEEIAKKSAFISKILSPNALSAFTHRLDIWKSKEQQIMEENRAGVPLLQDDISRADIEAINNLFNLYDIDMIDNSKVFSYGDSSFIFDKEEFDKLTRDHFKTLIELVQLNSVDNVSYVELDENGVMLID